MKKTLAHQHILVRNTGYLYIRLGLVMLLGFYVTREVLRVLGAGDFGIYSVVGSVSALITFFNSALLVATQRFLAYEIGSGADDRLREIFRNSLSLHCLIALAALLLLESVGLWFVNSRLNLPPERLKAANFIYQTGIALVVVNLIQIPYQSAVVAYERMDIFAAMGVLDAILKLLTALALPYLPFDKLETYGTLLLCSGAVVFAGYYLCCVRIFGTQFYFSCGFNPRVFAELGAFSGWYLFGGIAFVIMMQGGNILVNLFFGTLANSAVYIALQVNAGAWAFSSNLRQAIEPRIVKYHAAGEPQMMIRTLFVGTRYTLYLLLLLAAPLVVDMPAVLRLWLGNVPALTDSFCRLTLVCLLFQTFDLSFAAIFKAVGKVRENQLCSGAMYLLTLPTTYLAFRLGATAQWLFYLQIATAAIVAFPVKIMLMHRIVGIPHSCYWSLLAWPMLKTVPPCLLPSLLSWLLLPPGWLRFVVTGIATSLMMAAACLILDLNHRQRKQVWLAFAEWRRRRHPADGVNPGV